MESLLILCVVGFVIFLAIKGMAGGAGGGDDDEEGSSGGGRAVTHNHGSIDRFGNHDD
ncbi:MAG: hypothetical protein U1E12_09085 [Hydrogenophaga sp.]|uniref:hypothetical protein n=1 Tax=Hydrogenophaga sp. TaxID=1904254 RepID=UPI002AB933A4|nr:hypothetical protein [Hydrogenophaga sp.]MDZ4101815.1 hypothetical protein [Hydrogenophaga sp.]